MTDLGVLGTGTYSVASAINQAGDIVGASTYVPGTYTDRHAFLHRDGHLVDLGFRRPARARPSSRASRPISTTAG